MVVSVALASVLLVLSALHVVWAVRNRFEGNVVIPKVGRKMAFVPSRASTIVVAVALLAGALVALGQGRVIDLGMPRALGRLAAEVAGVAFLLRAIGEFRLVGFFKRVRDTDFARWDTWLFSPLSTVMGSAFCYLGQL